MSKLLAFILSLFSAFGTAPHTPPGPTPTPIIFNQYPSSQISVNWNSLAPDFTIFMEPDMKPCDHLERSISISNLKSQSRPITIRGLKTAEEKNFSQILNIKIFKDDVLVYGPKLLSQFFIDSSGPAGVSLGTLAGNSTSTYKIVVDFPCEAGNEYQKAKLVFKLKIGKLLTLPTPCPCSCYQTKETKYQITSRDRQVYADFSEGEKIECKKNSCALITQ
jgi:hypothetical protein